MVYFFCRRIAEGARESREFEVVRRVEQFSVRSARHPFCHPKWHDGFAFCAGELPLWIGRLKANGGKVALGGNQGFTLSADITDVMGDTKLDFSQCYLRGVRELLVPVLRASNCSVKVCFGRENARVAQQTREFESAPPR